MYNFWITITCVLSSCPFTTISCIRTCTMTGMTMPIELQYIFAVQCSTSRVYINVKMCHAAPCYDTPCQAILWHDTTRYDMKLHYIMLSHVMTWYLRRVVSILCYTDSTTLHIIRACHIHAILYALPMPMNRVLRVTAFMTYLYTTYANAHLMHTCPRAQATYC